MNTPQDRSFRQSADRPTPASAARDSGEDFAERASAEGQEHVQQYREAAADKVDALAGSIQAAAEELQDDDVAGLSRHVADMAGGLNRLSDGLREKSVEQILRDVRRVARENPTLFIAGSIAIGFGISRFARASREPERGNERERPSHRSEWSEAESSVPGTTAMPAGERTAGIGPGDPRASMATGPGPAASAADAIGARTGTTASGSAASDRDASPSTDAPSGRSQP